jgi:hypothetical protein
VTQDIWQGGFLKIRNVYKTSGGKYISATNHWKHNETIRFIDQII